MALLSGKTSFEILTGKIPKYDHLRIFGSLCYAHNHPLPRDKFAPCTSRYIFLGYPYGQKCHKLYDLDTCKIFISRDVIFHEHIFPFASDSISHPTNVVLSLPLYEQDNDTDPVPKPAPYAQVHKYKILYECFHTTESYNHHSTYTLC